MDRASWMEGMIENKGTEVGRLGTEGELKEEPITLFWLLQGVPKENHGSPGRLFENPEMLSENVYLTG